MMGSYLRPQSVADALDALAAAPRVVVAGGTDFYPARVGRPLRDAVLDITALPGLRGVVRGDGAWRIGALTTWTDVVRADLPEHFECLVAAAREVGGLQVQNAGTVCGNVCNASPAADGIPPLLALDAGVELASRAARREVPLSEFVLGNRATARAADELVTALIVPDPPPGTRSAFLKLGARRYLVISIAMVAAALQGGADGRVAHARIAVGACSAAAVRLAGAERALLGQPLAAGLDACITPAHVADLSPIDDVRGTGDYRRHAALTLARRAVAALAGAGAR